MFSKVIKEITIAARHGGADPEGNPRLRTAILAAKAVNMPGSNIDRAIQRGAGGADGTHYEEATYEGYAPGGVAVLVEVATDNKNRTAGDVRHILTRFGGAMAEAGAVSYLFKSRALIVVERAAAAEDALIEIVLEAGADDVTAGAEQYEIVGPPAALEPIKAALAAKSIPVQSGEVTKLASVEVPLDESHAGQVLKLMDALEDHDDVQKVYSNLNLPEAVLAKLAHQG
jgi:YebC/PmpR family DNA-binding regulatory protein